MKQARLIAHHRNSKPDRIAEEANPSRSAPPRPRRRSGLVPLPSLFVLLLLALGLAGLLIPRQSELVKRLVEDGRHDRALALVGQGLNAENGGVTSGQANPANLVEVLLDSIDHDFDDASRIRIDTLISITEDPGGVHDVLMQRKRMIPSEMLPGLVEQLATRAIQTGDPALAVKMYDELAEMGPLDLDQTHAWVVAARYAGQPRVALDAVTRHLETHQIPFTQLPEELRKLSISLHRELNEGSVAFDLLSEEFKATLEPESRHELVELIATVAAQSERLSDSLPILEDFLSETAAGKLDWRTLASRESTDPSDADFRKFGKMLAQNFEWNNRTSDGFDIYRKLAAMGDTEALDRCVTVYPWVDRQEDLTDLLETLVPVAGRERYTLLLARLQAERGKFPEAEAIYQAQLAGAHAKDPSLWFELAGILNAQERFDEARDAYQTALGIDGERHDIRVRLARLHVTLGNHPAALAEYKKIPAEAHDRKTREDFAMLAKSIDSPLDFIHAIQLKLEAESHTEPGAYLDMADAWESMADIAQVETTLREGLIKFPNSAALNLRLADFLTQQGRKEEAFDQLATADRIQDKRYASRLLGLGYETERFEQTLQLVSGRDVTWSPSERFDLASLYEETGNMETALSFYQQAEGGEADTARIEAEIAFMRGDVTRAIARQKDFLDLTTEPDYEAMTFLGDLQRAAGHTVEAEAAYQAALEQLKLQLSSTPENPAEDPEVAEAR